MQRQNATRKIRRNPGIRRRVRIGFIRGARRTGVLVAEGDVAIDEICRSPAPAASPPRCMGRNGPERSGSACRFRRSGYRRDRATRRRADPPPGFQPRRPGDRIGGRPLTSMTPALEVVRSPEGTLNLRRRLPKYVRIKPRCDMRPRGERRFRPHRGDAGGMYVELADH